MPLSKSLLKLPTVLICTTTLKKGMHSMMHDIIVFVNPVFVFRPRENHKTAFLLFRKYPNMCGGPEGQNDALVCAF